MCFCVTGYTKFLILCYQLIQQHLLAMECRVFGIIMTRNFVKFHKLCCEIWQNLPQKNGGLGNNNYVITSFHVPSFKATMDQFTPLVYVTCSFCCWADLKPFAVYYLLCCQSISLLGLSLLLQFQLLCIYVSSMSTTISEFWPSVSLLQYQFIRLFLIPGNS